MAPFVLLAACVAVGLIAWGATWAVLRGLVRWRVYDRPNPRSSHARATPRGGGLALVPVILTSWVGAMLLTGQAPAGAWLVLAGAAPLAAVSWIDDLRGLGQGPRLAIQVAAVALGLYGLGDAGPVFQGLLPPLLDRLAAGLLWLWFVNLFNFMDGIDGISGVEAGSLGGGLVLVGALAAWPVAHLALPALLAAASLGFLVWNWAPAKLFLGDVGSVPLGYLLGWLLLGAAGDGQWAAALLLPLYYLADATLTLARRAARAEKIWRAHREHFYQRAVRGGASHAAVSRDVLVCNAVLIACAAASALGHVWSGLAIGAGAVGILLAALQRRAAGAPPAAL